MANTTGKKFGGRQKGSVNKITLSIRKVFEQVFLQSGGVKSFVSWVEKSDGNRLEFYKMYSKLIPLDIQSSTGNIFVSADKSVDDV